MDLSQLESLLERIVDQNEQVIDLLREIKGELDWSSSLSLGKQLIDAVRDVERAVESVDSTILANG